MAYIKTHISSVVIAVLICGIVWLVVTRPDDYKPKYDLLKQQSDATIKELGAVIDKSKSETRQLREAIAAMEGTIHNLGNTAQGIDAEINGAAADNNEAIRILRELIKDLGSQGQGVQSGHKSL